MNTETVHGHERGWLLVISSQEQRRDSSIVWFNEIKGWNDIIAEWTLSIEHGNSLFAPCTKEMALAIGIPWIQIPNPIFTFSSTNSRIIQWMIQCSQIHSICFDRKTMKQESNSILLLTIGHYAALHIECCSHFFEAFCCCQQPQPLILRQSHRGSIDSTLVLSKFTNNIESDAFHGKISVVNAAGAICCAYQPFVVMVLKRDIDKYINAMPHMRSIGLLVIRLHI